MINWIKMTLIKIGALLFLCLASVCKRVLPIGWR
jgi:hypothetical protein